MAHAGIDLPVARLRFRAAYRHIRPGSHACDVGAASRRLFWITPGTALRAFGVRRSRRASPHALLASLFSSALSDWVFE
jgi:hypothetical protein